MLQGRAVTLTFKVGTQMLYATRRLSMVIISVQYFRNPTSNNKVIGWTRFLLQGRAVTLTFKVGTQRLRATRRVNVVIISVKKFRITT